MARTQTMVQLTDELIDLLDREAGRRGVSRSALIREAISEHLAEAREAEISRQIVEGYKRMPQGGKYDVDEWGDLGAFVTALAEESLKAIADEEREAGYPPW